MKKKIVIVFACCALVAALGLVGCGGASSSGASDSQTSSSASSASSSVESSTSNSSGDTTLFGMGYADKHSLMTAKAIIELDSEELANVAEKLHYEWDADKCRWSRAASTVSPWRGLTSEQYSSDEAFSLQNVTADDIAAFAMGAKGEPVAWNMYNTIVEYANSDAAFADQAVEAVDQCVVNNWPYGDEIWAIVQNSAGDRFLMEVRHLSSNNTGQVLVYTADYVAVNANGIESALDKYYPGLDEAHTIDAAWQILKEAAAA